jgi:hypothetical protein
MKIFGRYVTEAEWLEIALIQIAEHARTYVWCNDKSCATCGRMRYVAEMAESALEIEENWYYRWER